MVEKPVLVTTSYEGVDEEKELEPVSIINNNNNVNIVNDSNSANNIKNNNNNFLIKTLMMKSMWPPKTTINAKVVCTMKKFQALYNNNANNIIKWAMKEKSAMENLNFLIDLIMVTNDTKSVPEEHKTFNKAWDHPNENSHKKWQEMIWKKFANINKQQVWSMTSKSYAP